MMYTRDEVDDITSRIAKSLVDRFRLLIVLFSGVSFIAGILIGKLVL